MTTHEVFAALDQAIAQAVPDERPGLVVALAARLAQLGAGLAAETTSLPAPPADPLLNMPEVAARLGITEHQAREMGRRGEIPVVIVGERFVRVRARSLEDWIRRRDGATLAPSRRR